MITKEDIDVARKAINHLYEGEHHYIYLLDHFIDKVEKTVISVQIPALLRRMPSDVA